VGHGRPDWREHLRFATDLIPVTEEAAHREMAVVVQTLSALPVDATCFGLIHFDMEADNMRWRDGMPTVFDCDDCAHYWFAADVAYALRDLYDDRRGLRLGAATLYAAPPGDPNGPRGVMGWLLARCATAGGAWRW
jgi:Ser/Thr protein kinase RdoA (MazF antagonist)